MSDAGGEPVNPLTRVINTIHHRRLSPQQQELLIALLLNLHACSGVTSCPDMAQVQAAYLELLAAGTPRVPLTLDQLIALLVQLRIDYSDYGPRPVHLLNMNDDGDGLITDVDRDCFDEVEQGPVTSLLSSP
jgi:hypothetical protein